VSRAPTNKSGTDVTCTHKTFGGEGVAGVPSTKPDFLGELVNAGAKRVGTLVELVLGLPVAQDPEFDDIDVCSAVVEVTAGSDELFGIVDVGTYCCL